jgi:hypothetical protein
MHKSSIAMLGLKAWKMYFWFTTVLGLGTLLLDDFVNGLVQLFGVVGLYGYIWSRPIANYVVWQLYLLGLASLSGYHLLKLADPAVRYVLVQNELLAVSLLVIFVVLNGHFSTP